MGLSSNALIALVTAGLFTLLIILIFSPKKQFGSNERTELGLLYLGLFIAFFFVGWFFCTILERSRIPF